MGTIDEKLKGPYLGLRKKVEEMTVQDIRTEIDQVLATLSSEELKLVLSLLKQFKGNSPKNLELALNLGRIIQEDGEVLKKLAE